MRPCGGAVPTLFTRLMRMEIKEYDLIECVIRNLSHEIKNPLTTIKGYAQILEMKSGDSEVSAKARRTIIEQINRLDALFRDLYEIFTIRSGEEEEVDISRLVGAILETMPKEIYARTELVTGTAPILSNTDRELCARFITNILAGFDWENNQGARLRIEIRNNGLEAPEIRIIFKNADFSELQNTIFFLPFASKKHFKTGLELYEAYVIAFRLNWEFEMFVDETSSGFGIRL